MTMPGMNGLVLFRKIKAIRSSIPIILTSGSVSGKLMDTEKLDLYLEKPVQFDNLLKEINSLLKKKVVSP